MGFRGEVKGLELADDGLYALIELTEDGAKVVEKNPKLGASARIVEGLEGVGRAIQHIAGTLDPRAKGMKPWKAVELSSDLEVVDLTGAVYTEAAMEGLSDTDVKRLKAVADRLPAPEGSGGESPRSDEDLSEEEAQQLVDQLIQAANAEGEPQADRKREPAAALSEEQRRKIELAESRASEAANQAKKLAAELAQERFERERDSFIEAGVPPVLVELAAPVLKRESTVIELANGEKADAGEIMRKILREAEGTLNLSEVGAGHASGDDRDPEVAKWAEGEE